MLDSFSLAIRFSSSATHTDFSVVLPTTNPSTWFHPNKPRRDRHRLSVQHVRAIGIQIQAKVLETGYQVDVNGSCWASRPEIDRPTAGENGFGEQSRQHVRQQNLTQEPGRGEITERWREDLGDDDPPSGAAGHKTDNINVNASNSGSGERPQGTRTRSIHNEEWEDGEEEDRQRSLRGRHKNQRRRRRSRQASHTSDEDSHYRFSPATDGHGLLTSPPAGTQHPYSQKSIAEELPSAQTVHR